MFVIFLWGFGDRLRLSQNTSSHFLVASGVRKGMGTKGLKRRQSKTLETEGGYVPYLDYGDDFMGI